MAFPKILRSLRERAAFWIALSLAVLCLAGALLNPLTGVLLAIEFGLAAWGLWFKQAGAAAAAALLTGFPVFSVAIRWFENGLPLRSVPADAWGGLAIGIGLAAVFAVAGIRFIASPRGRSFLFVWMAAMAVYALFSIFTVRYFTPTAGMADTILSGDEILAQTFTTRLGRTPAYGQIVYFRYPVDPKQVFIKRIVGVPGDRIQIRHKELYRNGSAVREPYAVHKMQYEDSFRDNFPGEPSVPLYPSGREMLTLNVVGNELVVPAGKYFVLGDNRDQSLDSRYWGFISGEDVVARPLFVYGSNGGSTDAGGSRATDAAPQATSVFNTRWKRLFTRPE